MSLMLKSTDGAKNGCLDLALSTRTLQPLEREIMSWSCKCETQICDRLHGTQQYWLGLFMGLRKQWYQHESWKTYLYVMETGSNWIWWPLRHTPVAQQKLISKMCVLVCIVPVWSIKEERNGDFKCGIAFWCKCTSAAGYSDWSQK